MKYLYQSGAEECVFSDGTVERISGDGDRIVEFPNGQRETYTKLFKVSQKAVNVGRAYGPVFCQKFKLLIWYNLFRRCFKSSINITKMYRDRE